MIAFENQFDERKQDWPSLEVRAAATSKTAARETNTSNALTRFTRSLLFSSLVKRKTQRCSACRVILPYKRVKFNANLLRYLLPFSFSVASLVLLDIFSSCKRFFSSSFLVLSLKASSLSSNCLARLIARSLHSFLSKLTQIYNKKQTKVNIVNNIFWN